MNTERSESNHVTLKVKLRCVECGAAPLDDLQDAGYRCHSCGQLFAQHSYRRIPVIIGSRSTLSVPEILEQEVKHRHGNVQAAMRHWKTGNLAELLKRSSGKSLLNIGSGDGGDRNWLESQGYELTTLDVYAGPFTDVIADGHALPFIEKEFDLVTAIAVFEYLQDPFVAALEMNRVLKPGGALIGSTAFLEPFHSSYFHMSHVGLREVLRRGGFRNIEIYPGWSFTEALGSSFYLWNRVPVIQKMTRLLQKMRYGFGMSLWKTGYRMKRRNLPEAVRLGYCGSLIFRAEK
jgi:ubiquinone/menaquinone biosynthesis C-methylase UbiE